MADTAEIGQIGWIDISIDEAKDLSDFYSSVVGWKSEAQSMGDYSDYTMLTPDSGSPIAGVCHARFCVIEDPAGAVAGLYQAG